PRRQDHGAARQSPLHGRGPRVVARGSGSHTVGDPRQREQLLRRALSTRRARARARDRLLQRHRRRLDAWDLAYRCVVDIAEDVFPPAFESRRDETRIRDPTNGNDGGFRLQECVDSREHRALIVCAQIGWKPERGKERFLLWIDGTRTHEARVGLPVRLDENGTEAELAPLRIEDTDAVL